MELTARPDANAAVLQEAIDSVVASFDHPSRVDLRYEATDGTKRTVIEVHDEESRSYELRFDGHLEDEDPTLEPIDR